MSEHVLGPDAGDRPTVARIGDHVVIRLPENPTTGYRWRVDDVDDRVLTLESSTFEPPEPPIPGAGGWRAIHLRAVGPGTARLHLALGRPGQTAADDYSATVDVVG
jgi:inhibitor of cysteine peptidase